MSARISIAAFAVAAISLATTSGAQAQGVATPNSEAKAINSYLNNIESHSLGNYVRDWTKPAAPVTKRTNTVAISPKAAVNTGAIRDMSEKLNAGGDYLPDMLRNGRERWSPASMPLSVYIPSDGNYSALVAQAMNEWCAASNGKISWRQATSPGANIDVNFIGGTSAQSGETRKSFAGGGIITHANANIALTENGRAYCAAEVKKICLHELGHALGLDHSSTPGDIMYFQSNSQQLSCLRARDSRTIQELYSM